MMPHKPPSFDELTDSQKIIVLSLGLNDAQTKVSKHEETLFVGNGDLPLVERLRNVEAFVNSIKYWIRLLVGAILIQTIAFAAAAIVYFVRLYPILSKIAEDMP